VKIALLGLGCVVLALTRVGERARNARAPLTIAIAPIGAVSAAAVERLLGPIRDAFAADVRIAPALRLPSSGYDRRRAQYLSTSILDALASARPSQADRLLGVVDVDLYMPDLNFVFGEADPRRGVAVFSLARLASSDPAVAERRAKTEAIHELGHAYGLSHCDDRRCVMWFSNTLAESDRKGTRFCSRHAAELEALRSRPRARTVAR
jgi:archaemetzincin